MKNKIKIILITLLISMNVYSQWEYTNIQNVGNANYNYVCDKPSFINADIGYIAIPTVINNETKVTKLYKTTNSGMNWFFISNVEEQFNIEKNVSINFINESTGYCAMLHTQYSFYSHINISKTTNGGLDWNSVWSNESVFTTGSQIIPRIKFINATIGYLQLNKSLLKTNNGGIDWEIKYECPSGKTLNDIEISKLNENIVFIGGDGGTNPPYSFLIRSNDGFNSWVDVGVNYPEIGNIKCINIIKDNINNEYLKIGSQINATEDAQDIKIGELNMNNVYRPLCLINFLSDYEVKDIAFSSYSNGFINVMARSNSLESKYILSTSDGGYNFSNVPEYETFGKMQRFDRINDVIYLPLIDYNLNNSYPLFLLARKVNMRLMIFDDITPTTGIMKIKGTDYNISDPENTYYYLRGGTNQVRVDPDKETGNKLFYKWNNGSLNYNCGNYYFDTKSDITAYYKTKNISTDENAIKNTSQTKVLRDSAGMQLFQIHQSLGGIFFTYTTTPTSPFLSEQVVNSGYAYNSHFPSDKTAEGNKNPSICEIKYWNNSPGQLPINYRFSSVWERYNQGINKTQIFAAIKVDQVINPWLRYCTNPNDPYVGNGVVREFNCNDPEFNSKPEIISARIQEDGDQLNPYNYFYIIPHLEPAANGKKLVITALYKQFLGYDEINLYTQTNDFIIEDGYVSDFAVDASQQYWVGGFEGGAFYLHLVYVKNGEVIYRLEKIHLFMNGTSTNIHREIIENTVNNNQYTVSAGTADVERVNPDISLKNGKPIVTYRGKIFHQEIVHYEEGEDQILTYYTYPVYVRSQIDNATWGVTSSYSSTLQQDFPDIEGSKDAGAYIVNFKRSNVFKKYVKIDNLNGHLCNPEEFAGSDAKIAKGSFRGTTGANSYPTLLTLSYPGNAQYIIGVQNFTIVNISSEEDGFSNLSGSIEKNNSSYMFDLGPIFVSNTFCGFSDDNPWITIHNPVDFNDNMKSKGFLLSDNDTLILGAKGYYIPINQPLTTPMKYHVDLLNKSTNQIFKELFRDTIKVEDSTNLEFLRGYIVKGISNGSDSFYVQLFVDPADAISDSYALCGEYQDPGVVGDNISRYKTKVFFENESPHNNTVNNIPKSFELLQNYPNPFNPSTTIKYALPKNEFVTIKVYDIVGREIMRLVSEYKPAGFYTVNFNGSNLASGVYFYRIQAGDFMNVKRMVLIK